MRLYLERPRGLEPHSSAWKAEVLTYVRRALKIGRLRSGIEPALPTVSVQDLAQLGPQALNWSAMQGSNLRFSAPKADDIPLA